MSKFLRKRQFNTTKELVDLTREYFDEEDFIMIETYYDHIGVNKHNVRDGRNNTTNKKYNQWVEVIDYAREKIHSHLARVTIYGQTEAELEHTKVVKSEDNENDKTTGEFNRADPKVLQHYMNSRFQDKGDAQEEKVHDPVTIVIENKGPNALLEKKDA